MAIDLGGFDVQRVWEGALRLLEEVGLSIPGVAIRRRLAGALPIDGEVARVPREVASHFAGEIRARGDGRAAPPVERLRTGNSGLNTHWFDAAAWKIRPHTLAKVIEHTRLTTKLTEEGELSGSAAGVPTDVPPVLQFALSHYAGCVYGRKPGPWPLIADEESRSILFALDDAMGLGHAIATEMISPMTFAGASIDMALEHHRSCAWVGIDPMPILGVSAPADWHAAWAQSVAEGLASYAFFRLCGLENVGTPTFRLFVPNLRAAAAYFSAPQHATCLLMRRAVRSFFNLGTGGGELLLVTSKAPDQQAAMEKAAGAAFAAQHGFGFVEGAGGLWLDEIFSPEQLLIDLEIVRFANATRMPVDEPVDAVGAVREGMGAGTFLGTALLADRIDRVAWRPRLSDLDSRSAWSGRAFLERAGELAREKTEAGTYELQDGRREAVERIVADAARRHGADIMTRPPAARPRAR